MLEGIWSSPPAPSPAALPASRAACRSQGPPPPAAGRGYRKRRAKIAFRMPRDPPPPAFQNRSSRNSRSRKALGCILPHPARHVQAALCRAAPSCGPLRQAAAGCWCSCHRCGREVAVGGGGRLGQRGENAPSSFSNNAARRSQGPQPLATVRALPRAAQLLRAPPCRVRVAAGFPRGGCSLAPCAPRKRRKQVITGG